MELPERLVPALAEAKYCPPPRNEAACFEAATKAADNSREKCRIRQNGRSGMFEINGFDTAGVVSLKRPSLAAALKKAKELIQDGCWDVQIVDPNGRIYTSFEEQAA